MSDECDNQEQLFPDFDFIISMSDPAEAKALIALDEEQFDTVTANVWNTAWCILWTSMTAIFVPDNDNLDEWYALAEDTSKRAKRAMMRAIASDMNEVDVMKSAVAATCKAIVKQIKRGAKV